jgi:hypothetical protein
VERFGERGADERGSGGEIFNPSGTHRAYGAVNVQQEPVGRGIHEHWPRASFAAVRDLSPLMQQQPRPMLRAFAGMVLARDAADHATLALDGELPQPFMQVFEPADGSVVRLEPLGPAIRRYGDLTRGIARVSFGEALARRREHRQRRARRSGRIGVSHWCGSFLLAPGGQARGFFFAARLASTFARHW